MSYAEPRQPDPSFSYRILEMIPGTLLWSTLIGAVVFSFAAPKIAIAFIIAFDLYWLLRVTYFVVFLTASWRNYRRDIRIPWFHNLQTTLPQWQTLTHLIFLPMAHEPIGILCKTLQAIKDAHYDHKKMIIVLAGEERMAEHFRSVVDEITTEFAGVFGDFLVTTHPSTLPDEIPGKGSNLNFAGHEVQKYIDARGIPYASIIVSAFDVDTVVHPEYFASLTTVFLKTPDRLRCSYQPVALYNNNMWESNAIVRVASFGTTFWLLTELARPERLFTFSSHSMSWQALVDIDFWEKRIVTEDSRIFLQCLIRYDGAYRVEPLYIPVSMNTVTVPSLWRTLANLYRQQRRWAWGVEHFPYMVWNFLFRPNKIPWRTKFYYLFNLGEGMYSWATAPILIFILGSLPLRFADQTLVTSAFYQNTPFILQGLLRLAMVGIFVSAIFAFFLMPPRPEKNRPHRVIILLLQWLLLPVTLILFGAIPAIEAQTRLMIGKRLGFWVTEKR